MTRRRALLAKTLEEGDEKKLIVQPSILWFQPVGGDDQFNVIANVDWNLELTENEG